MGEIPHSERSTVRRKPDRGSYDRDLIYTILDEAFVCHLGFVHDGQPFVMPTNYVRDGDRLLLHGSTAGRMMKALASGAPLCLTVTLLDGIVFAPTATGHSVNYRSVVVLGKARPIEGEDAKRAAMRAFVNHVIRGRWQEVSPPTEQELKGTMVLEVPLTEVSAKVRTGFAVDDQEDYASGAWTGVVPMKWTAGEPIPDPRGNSAVPVPEVARNYSRTAKR
jgi:nitroimidazol reductase NimA-like FMN-containing flavoprotein (pyridoxamine 5'-phosphate oxidase superfamily)